MDALAMRGRVVGLRRFWLSAAKIKITGIILTLINVPICLKEVHIITISFHPFPSLCDLLLMAHKDNTQLGKF